MRKILVLWIMSIFALNSCGKDAEISKEKTKVSKEPLSSVELLCGKDISWNTLVKEGAKVTVEYIGYLEDGTVFDTSCEESAKLAIELGKNTDSLAQRSSFNPLDLVVGSGQVIPGFDNGLKGLTVGEKVTIKIAPKDAYGENFEEIQVPKEHVQDTILETQPKEMFKDSEEQTLPRDSFAQTIKKTIPKDQLSQDKTWNVWDVIEENGSSITVTEVTEDNITIEMENTQNPFLGEELTIGLSKEVEGNKIEIIDLDEENVTIKIDYLSNPFYGKEIKAGMEATIGENKIVVKEVTDSDIVFEVPNLNNPFYGKEIAVGTEGKGGYTITGITDTEVKMKVENTHPLAGKTLYFDVIVVSAENPTTEAE